MQLAPDTYSIVTSDELGGVIGAKKAGLEQATAYCAERGKQMIVMQSQSDVRRDWVNDPVAHHDVTFRCAAPGERVQTVMGGAQNSLVVR